MKPHNSLLGYTTALYNASGVNEKAIIYGGNVTKISTRVFMVSFLAVCLVGAIVYGRSRESKRLEKATQNIAVKVAQPHEYKPFVLIICSYNNAEYAEANILSALSQVYSNYRIIFIDDASTDDTFNIVKHVVESRKAIDRVTLIRNSHNQGAMANTYRATHLCRNDEIVVMLDGDDRLKGPRVLKELNAYYNNRDVWMTYGQCVESTTGELGQSKPMSRYLLKSGRIKHKAWVTSHPRTYYAGLFKRIKTEHFMHEGQFLPMAADVAAMLPMIEMAREHVYYISEPLYVYNLDNPINDHKKSESKQEFYNQYVRQLPVYEKLSKGPWNDEHYEYDTSDVMTFSYNRPLQLYAFLESMERYVKGLGDVMVIYRASDERYARGYDEVKKRFPTVQFIRQNHDRAKQEFKTLVMKNAFKKGGYITFSTDDLVIKDAIDLTKDIRALEKTQMHALFYRLGSGIDYCYMTNFHQGVPNLVEVGDDLYTWRYDQAKGDWAYPHSVDFVLYRKEDIRQDFEKIPFTYPNDLEGIWASKAKLNRYGLCHGKAKMVNFPLNLISNKSNRAFNEYPVELLLKIFENGKKMDLNPIHDIENRSVHMDYHPTFVMREACAG